MEPTRCAILASDNVTVVQLIVADATFCATAFPGVTCVCAPYNHYFVDIGYTWNATTGTFSPPAN
jgi:hypothetical protein